MPKAPDAAAAAPAAAEVPATRAATPTSEDAAHLESDTGPAGVPTRARNHDEGGTSLPTPPTIPAEVVGVVAVPATTMSGTTPQASPALLRPPSSQPPPLALQLQSTQPTPARHA